MRTQTNNTGKPWKKWKNRQGFTLAELLIVIAIILIVAGFGFVNVIRYQKDLKLKECDDIARQIFIAAQNHLSAARGEGYLGRSKFGKEGKADGDIKGNYYFVVTDGSVLGDADEIFDLMLPFGALDETIRTGGSYLIRYNKDSGTVLDVFYCSTHGSPARFNHEINIDDYAALLAVAGDDNKALRRTYKEGNNCILGWYGGAEGIEHKEALSAPRITTHNEEILWVDVTDDNGKKKGASLRLEVTGETSGAVVVFYLRKDGVNTTADDRIKWEDNNSTCHVVLDDITTAGRHFNDINNTTGNHYEVNGTFRPGENLTIKAIAYNNTGFAYDALSKEKKTNRINVSATTAQVTLDRKIEEKSSFFFTTPHLPQLSS